MKKLLVLFVACSFLIGCQTPHRIITHTFDYTEYTDKGFFLTESESVGFDYTPIAGISITLADGTFSKGNPVPEGLGTHSSSSVVNFLPKDALKQLYTECIKLGANGVIGLKLQSRHGMDALGRNVVGVTTISGTAIKK
jgi:hypothetical protein